MQVIAVAGAKGGVGKTAAAVNLAFLSAASGHRTLLWDLDPQGAATHCYRARAKVKGGASRMLSGKRDLQGYARRTDFPHLDLLPADGTFRVADTVLGTRRWPDRVLRKLLRPLDRSYDVVVLDCAPGLGVVTESVVAASDLVLAPIVPAPLAVRSLDQLDEFVQEQRPGLTLLAFLSMVDERKVLHRQMLDLVRSDRRFALSAVPVSSAVERMGLEQVPAVLASPLNLAAAAYRQLWVEVTERMGLEPGELADLDALRAQLGVLVPPPVGPVAASPAAGDTESAATEPEPDPEPEPESGSEPEPADPFAGWFSDPV
jgi:cellulose biosynthesis protein BcsQ